MDNSKLKSTFLLIAGIVIGILAMWVYSLVQGIEPYVVEGYSSGANYDGSALGLAKEVGGTGESEGYIIAGARWREFSGPWHDSGTPPSLEWPSYGQRIGMGVIDYEPTEYAPGSSVVVWLEVFDTEHMVKK